MTDKAEIAIDIAEQISDIYETNRLLDMIHMITRNASMMLKMLKVG